VIKDGNTIIYNFDIDAILTIKEMEDKMEMQELIDCIDLSDRITTYMLRYRHESYNTLKVGKDYEVKMIFGSGIGNRSLILDKKGKIKFSLFEDETPLEQFQTGNILNLDTVNFLEKYKYTELDAKKSD